MTDEVSLAVLSGTTEREETLPTSQCPSLDLHHATCGNNLDVVKNWIDYLLRHSSSASLNDYDCHGYTALHYAAKYNHFPIFHILLEAGADPNIPSKNEKFTSLHFLAYYHKEEMEGKDGSKEVEGVQQAAASTGAHLVRVLKDKQCNMSAVDASKSTPLHLACRKGNFEMVRSIMLYVGSEAAIFQHKCANETPLHEACRSGNVEVVKELLECIPQQFMSALKKQNIDGSTPVHIACEEGHEAVLKYILAATPDDESRHALVNAEDIKKRTPLQLACEFGDSSVVELLIKSGAKNLPDKYGLYPLHTASRSGHVNIVKKLLTLEGFHEVNLKDMFQQTPLHYAARYNRVEIIQLLLEKGASTCIMNKEFHTPLLVATIGGHVEAVETLIAGGASLVDADFKGKTAIHIAAERNNGRLLEIILDISANSEKYHLALLNSIDGEGNTALHLAAREGNGHCVEILLKHKRIHAEAKNFYDWTPMHFSARYGHTSTMEILLKKPCSFLAEDKDGNTALHLVCEYGHYKAVKLLLQYQMGLHQRNAKSWSPLDAAARNGNEKIVQLLIDAKSEVNPKSQVSPLLHAIKQGNSAVVKVLLQNGADVRLPKPNSRVTPIEVAIKHKEESVVTAIIESDQWEEALHCKWSSNTITTPFKELIKEMPQVAQQVLNRCVSVKNLGNDKVETTFNFTYIEDSQRSPFCQRNARHHKNRKGYTELNEGENQREAKGDKGSPKISKSMKEHPLLIMADENRKELLQHCLTSALINYKWKNFGVPYYFSSVAMFTLYMIVLTIFALLSPNPQGSTCQAVFSGEFGQVQNDSSANLQSCLNLTSTSSSDSDSLGWSDVCSNARSRMKCEVSDVDCGICPRSQLRYAAWVLFIAGLIILIVQVVEIISRRSNYFHEWTKALEWTQALCTVVFSTSFLHDCTCSTNLQWQFGALAVFLGWIYFLIFLELMPIGVHILMFEKIFITFWKAIFLTSILVVSFALAFYMLFFVPTLEFSRSAFASPARSHVKVMTMTTGELDFDGLFRQYSDGTSDEIQEIPFLGVSFALWILFLILMPVLLSNLLTGLAIDDVQQIREDAEFTSLKLKIRFALNTEATLSLLTRKDYTKDLEELECSEKPTLLQYVNLTVFGIKPNSEISEEYLSEQQKEDTTIDDLHSEIKDIKEDMEEVMKKLMSMKSAIQNLSDSLSETVKT